MSSSSGTPPETAPATHADGQWVGFVVSTTGFAAWLVKRVWFGSGEIPVEVSGMIQYGIPLVMGAAAAEWRWWKAKHRAAAPSPTEADGQ
jgi:hypothetical protein